MKRIAMVICVLVALTSAMAWAGGVSQPTEEKHRTTLGKYTVPNKAYMQWKASPDKTKLLDVRTAEEYYFVGHPEMAVNIPFLFSTGKLNPATNKPQLKKNENFLADVKKRFKPDDTIIVFCRSGERAAKAVNALAEAGFKNAYNLLEGFEGDKVKEEGSVYKGKRMKNGWKNSGAPWTYDLKEDLIYQPK